MTLEHGLPNQCTTGDVRLVDTRVNNSQVVTVEAPPYGGRVEICDNQTWKTVCDYAWGHVEARAVCRQLNFTGAGNGSRGYSIRLSSCSPKELLDKLR